ncbi:hypothetical protein [Litorilinea aerophila]|uniref:Uncharacterized protein n=1 Tax=Litorilinea aerophila TaxID=1204385 RepID=A0A540VM69_9CHLR|nr:hypothetical protein [Litorilinea aerophila]
MMKSHEPSTLNRFRGSAFVTLLLGIQLMTVVIRHGWLSDDAYITFRTAYNWIHGFGPVWNVGERVQSYTHPLWLLLLTPAFGLTGEVYYTTLALSLGLTLATAWAVVRWAGERATPVNPGRNSAAFPLVETIGEFRPWYLRQPVLAWLLLLALSLSKAFVEYSTSGLENPLTHLLLALFMGLALRPQLSRKRLFLLSLLAGLGVLNRMDTLLLFGPPLLYAWWRGTSAGAPGRGRLGDLLAVAAGFLPWLAWEGFALAYYGFLFPNTAYAKLNTGIGQGELTHQGLLYLLNALATDPVTVAVILSGLLLSLGSRRPALRWSGVALALYLAYVVRIGGDFMAGRFLSAPFLMALLLLAEQVAHLPRRFLLAGAAVLVAMALANPSQSPLLAIFGADSNPAQVSESGIVDERRYYLGQTGLLAATRGNRLPERGIVQGVTDPVLRVDCGGIGLRGFTASPFTHVVDSCGLTDPLLARLPAAYTPGWRIGHFERTIPEGYLGSLRTGRNLLTDPGLAAYYDRLRLVTQGPIFSPARWAEIWRFQTGQNQALIDWERYRYPDLLTLAVDQVSRRLPGGERPGEPRPLGASGIALTTEEPVHATTVLMGIDCQAVLLRYTDGTGQSQLQRVNTPTLQFGVEKLMAVPVPEPVRAAGIRRIHLLPVSCRGPALRWLDLVAEDGSRPLALEQVLDLYFFTYYRNVEATRGERLAALEARLQAFPATSWEEVPVRKLVALLGIPVPTIQALTLAHLPTADLLGVPGQDPALRYLGHGVDGEEEGLEVDLYFEVLNRPPFPVRLRLEAASPGEPPQVIATPEAAEEAGQWEPGIIQKMSADLALPDGTYVLTLCSEAREGEATPVFAAASGPCVPLGTYPVPLP